MKYAGADWVRKSLQVENMSPLGEAVANLLGDVWLGIYHLDNQQLRKVDWSDDYHVQVVISDGIATFDNDLLTRLVLFSHDRLLRIEIDGHTHRYLKLIFHQRKNRDGRYFERMPTIENHISALREHYGGDHAISD